MAPSPTSGEDASSKYSVFVADSGPGSLTQSIQAGHHELIADEPPGIGDDKGPTPHDILLAALGSCITMTLRMYADRKEWPLERAAVRLSRERIRVEGSAEDDRTRFVEHIDVRLMIEGDLDDDQVDRLLEIAERCPVHRTLTGDIRIQVDLD